MGVREDPPHLPQVRGNESVSEKACAEVPEPATTQWAPGRELRARVRFSLPATVPTGDYVLKVSMLSGDARAPAQRVKIGAKGCDEEGRHSLGPVRVAR